MKLLIVDDQVSSQFKLVEQLQGCARFQNSDLRIASNGLEAIAIVEQHDVDLILIDLQMPVMDGLTTTKKILSKYPHIKIIIITSVDDRFLVQKSMRAGAQGYLFKENIPTNLSSVIQNVSEGYNVFPNYNINNTNLFFDFDSTVQPSESDRILKINQIIASKIINAWMSSTKKYNFIEGSWWHFGESDPKNRQDPLDYLFKGDSDKCTLVEELELRYEQLVSKRIYEREISEDHLENELSLIIGQLNHWFYTEQVSDTFSCFKSRLEANAQRIVF
ncbi:MAG: response regulator transcription factor [Pleurocapsa sp. MO_226.B13]|nr:response regulator transcription factor [Pleurocapsa sp. MO_226.B13]